MHNLWNATDKVETIKKYIDEGANIHILNSDGQNLLISAINKYYRTSCVDVIKFLIEAGINIDQQDNYGRNALMEAVYNGYKEIVDELLNAGANVNLRDKQDNTVLMQMMRTIFPPKYITLGIVDSLIETGANVNIQNGYDGWTALMYAANYNHRSFIQKLLDANADISIQNRNNDTVLDIAKKIHNEEIAHIIQNYRFKLIERQDYMTEGLLC